MKKTLVSYMDVWPDLECLQNFNISASVSPVMKVGECPSSCLLTVCQALAGYHVAPMMRGPLDARNETLLGKDHHEGSHSRALLPHPKASREPN